MMRHFGRVVAIKVCGSPPKEIAINVTHIIVRNILEMFTLFHTQTDVRKSHP